MSIAFPGTNLSKESRFLISGSKGVLGKRIVARLRAVASVVEFEGDITNREHVERNLQHDEGFSHVINCAATVPVQKVTEDPISAFRVNAIGAGLLARVAAEKFRGVHFLQVSSSHVYKPSSLPILETDELAPITAYGKSKLAGEYIVQELQGLMGFELCIARLFSLYADDQKGDYLLPVLKRKNLSHGDQQFFSLPGWNNVRDFSSADSLAEAVIWLSERRIQATVNVGSGIPMTVGEFAQNQLGRPLVFDPQDEVDHPNQLVADISLLKKMGYVPRANRERDNR